MVGSGDRRSREETASEKIVSIKCQEARATGLGSDAIADIEESRRSGRLYAGCSGTKIEDGAINRAAHLHRMRRKGRTGRRREREAVAAAAEACHGKIGTMTIGKHLPDQPVAGVNVETHRRLGVLRILRPAGNDAGADKIHLAAQWAGERSSR